jgi:hypothetical protein
MYAYLTGDSPVTPRLTQEKTNAASKTSNKYRPIANVRRNDLGLFI